MKNNVTAVEWLVDQLEKWEIYSKISFQCLKEIEQAKEMEKEQGKELYFEATKYACSCYEGPTKEDFEEDYNTIYEK